MAGVGFVSVRSSAVDLTTSRLHVGDYKPKLTKAAYDEYYGDLVFTQEQWPFFLAYLTNMTTYSVVDASGNEIVSGETHLLTGYECSI